MAVKDFRGGASVAGTALSVSPKETGPPGPPDPGPQISANNSGGSDAAARLVAMKLAVDGKSRDEIESELAEKFGDADRSALLDDVLARAGN